MDDLRAAVTGWHGSHRALRVAAQAFLLGAALTAAGCGRMEAAPPLSHAALSRDALVQQMLDALASRDRTALEGLAMSEGEFRERIWPRLPASRPRVGMPVEYVWADTSAKSRAHLARLLAEYGGRRFTLDRVISGRAIDYGSFSIHPETRLKLRDDHGRATEHRLFGSLVEADEGWKIYSYVVD